MKPRKVIVTLELETDEKLVRLGRKEFWAALIAENDHVLVGKACEIKQATALVSQPRGSKK